MKVITNFIMAWSNDGLARFLHWNDEIQAPVSNIMSRDEYIEYEKYYLQDINLSFVYPESTDLDRLEIFRQLIKDNKAGRHGKTITWEEIKELYSGPL